jgi:hypothetical protein
MSFTKQAPRVKVGVPDVPPVANVVEKKFSTNMVTKLLPFIFAGTAVGVSVLALKELKKIKNEMGVLKTQQSVATKTDPEISKKMESFEIQLKKINEFLMNNNAKNPKIIKSVLKTEMPSQVNIINEDEGDQEYEEVEVTDDELDD